MAAPLLEPALLRRLESLALQVRRAVSGQMGGERRSLRLRLLELKWTLAGSALTLSFTLPPGAYATSVMRELMKSPEMSSSSPP